jgi:hypothetical protein
MNGKWNDGWHDGMLDGMLAGMLNKGEEQGIMRTKCGELDKIEKTQKEEQQEDLVGNFACCVPRCVCGRQGARR